MDLSKLPKLSNSQEPPASAAGAPSETAASSPGPVADYQPRQALPAPGIAGDVWFNAVVGLVLIGLGFTFAKFLIAKLTGQPFHTNVTWQVGPNAGSEVAYFDLEGFTAWTDAGVFLFGLVLLLEAATKAAIVIRPGALSKSLLMLAFALTIGATALNLYVAMRILGTGVIPLLSGLAVAFGGWILADEWRMLRLL